MSQQSFLNLCYTVLGMMFQILDLAVEYWYFSLLFAAGLIGLGFEVIAELHDYNNYN